MDQSLKRWKTHITIALVTYFNFFFVMLIGEDVKKGGFEGHEKQIQEKKGF